MCDLRGAIFSGVLKKCFPPMFPVLVKFIRNLIAGDLARLPPDNDIILYYDILCSPACHKMRDQSYKITKIKVFKIVDTCSLRWLTLLE